MVANRLVDGGLEKPTFVISEVSHALKALPAFNCF